MDGHERDADHEGGSCEDRHQDEHSVDSLPIFECPVHENVASAEADQSASMSHNCRYRPYDTIQLQPKSNQKSATKRSSEFSPNYCQGDDYEHVQMCELQHIHPGDTQVPPPLLPQTNPSEVRVVNKQLSYADNLSEQPKTTCEKSRIPNIVT